MIWLFAKQKGFSLVETIIYVGATVLLATVVINSLLTVVRNQTDFQATRNLASSASVVLERLTREIRQAYDVSETNSTFGINPGKLSLLATDNEGTPVSVYFEATSSNFYVQDMTNGFYPLLPSNIVASSVVFHLIDTGNSKAIKTELVLLETSIKTATRTEKFYVTTVLRGSYGED